MDHWETKYIVLQPNDSPGPLTVTLGPGTYKAEWFSVNRRETESASQVAVKSGQSRSFTAPFSEAGPVVLYLKRVGP